MGPRGEKVFEVASEILQFDEILLNFSLNPRLKISHEIIKHWKIKVKIHDQKDFLPIVYFLQKLVFANYAPGALLRFFGLIKGGLQVFVLGP